MNKRFGRALLKFWARTGVAPAFLHYAIDRWGPSFGEPNLSTKLFDRFKVDVDLSDHVQRRMFYLGAYEIIDAYLIRLLTKPGMTFVDAGANIGQYALLAAEQVGASGKVHAFEPVASNLNQLMKNVTENGLSDRVIINQRALWHEKTVLQFCLPDDKQDNQGSYTVSNRNSELSCKAVTLDDYAHEHAIDKIHILKMDIEGSELNALLGAEKLLRRSKPIILLEVNYAASAPFGYTQADIQAFLDQMGYHYWRIGDSVEHSSVVSNLSEIDRANILCHVQPLPSAVTSNWSLKKLLRTRGCEG